MGALIFKGVMTGIILSVMIGPVFFMLLEISIRRGARAAMAFDLGVLISDLLYIAIAFFFFSEIKELTGGENKQVMNFAGGIIFILFALVFLLKKPSQKADELGISANTAKDYWMLGLKGFFLNFTNPMVIFYWLSVLTLGTGGANQNDLNQNALIFVTVILTTFFSVDLLKIYGAKKLRPFITDKVLTAMNRTTGVVILLTGVYLVFKGFQSAYS